jgi:negative regulator of genetic competence, sporulation and motility
MEKERKKERKEERKKERKKERTEGRKKERKEGRKKERKKEKEKESIFDTNQLELFLHFSDICNFYTSTSNGTLFCWPRVQKADTRTPQVQPTYLMRCAVTHHNQQYNFRWDRKNPQYCGRKKSLLRGIKFYVTRVRKFNARSISHM